MTEYPKPNWVISDAQLEDASAIAKMHAQSWLDTYIGIQPGVTDDWVEKKASDRETQEGIAGYETIIQAAHENPEKYFYKVAKDINGNVIGFGSGSKTDDNQELTALYMDKSSHGSGVASAMAEQLMSWFDTNRDIELTVAMGNDRALAFYEKIGFKVVPSTERNHSTAEELRVVTMIKLGDTNEV